MDGFTHEQTTVRLHCTVHQGIMKHDNSPFHIKAQGIRIYQIMSMISHLEYILANHTPALQCHQCKTLPQKRCNKPNVVINLQEASCSSLSLAIAIVARNLHDGKKN